MTVCTHIREQPSLRGLFLYTSTMKSFHLSNHVTREYLTFVMMWILNFFEFAIASWHGRGDTSVDESSFNSGPDKHRHPCFARHVNGFSLRDFDLVMVISTVDECRCSSLIKCDSKSFEKTLG